MEMRGCFRPSLTGREGLRSGGQSFGKRPELRHNGKFQLNHRLHSQGAAIKKVARNAPCWCGSGKKYKKCHLSQDDEARRTRAAPTPWKHADIVFKTPAQIEGIYHACQLTKEILDLVGERIGAGVTTAEINRWVHEETLARNAIPAPLNYKGFPKSVCTSINSVICHGIPDGTLLEDGDIINVDVTTIADGYYGDASRMFLIGEVSKAAKQLVATAKDCLEIGILQVRPGATVGDIGYAIQRHAEKLGYTVVREFTGHGIGISFHEAPVILHYGKRGKGMPLLPNMTFTIEPMINAGRRECQILSDGWTAVTRDGSLSAQWEHTLLVTETGVEILTA